MSRKDAGFTLIEMLVVLVILAMTTTLFSQGLTTTWQNFQRLGVRDLSLSAAQLPAQWFRDSVKGGLLYHPYKPVVAGGPTNFSLVSSAVPNMANRVPLSMEWMITDQDGVWSLAFASEQADAVVVKESLQKLQFEYLVEGEWVTLFDPEDSRLPSAVRIKEGTDDWAMAVPGRPIMADIPTELPAYGEYAF